MADRLACARLVVLIFASARFRLATVCPRRFRDNSEMAPVELRTGNPVPSLDRQTVVGPEGPESTGAEMSVSRSVSKILSEHVTLELEGIDRMYLNLYVPALQRAGGIASFFRFHRGHPFASSVL